LHEAKKLLIIIWQL